MGFLSILGDIAGLGLAPFTGGASLALGPAAGGALDGLFGGGGGQSALGSLSQNLGGAAAGQTALRQTNANIAGVQGNLAQKLYQDAQNKYLTGAVTMPTTGAAMAAKGDQLANVQDVVPQGNPYVMSHVVNYSGGLRPSNFGPNARQAGQNLSNAGLKLQTDQANLPALWQMPQGLSSTPGGLESTLNYGALGAGATNSISQIIRQLLAKQTQGGGDQSTGLTDMFYPDLSGGEGG